MTSIAGGSDKAKPTRRPLPDKTVELLREGRDADPYGVQMSVVLSMRQHGWTEAQVWRALRDPENRAGGWTRGTIRKHGVRAARNQFAALVLKADARISEHPPIGDRADAIDALAGVLAAADAQPWPGRSGTTDRLALDVFVRLAIHDGGPEFRASLRQVAEGMNRRVATAHAAAQRLQASGWLVQVRRGAGDHGSTWRLPIGARATVTVPCQRNRMKTVPLSLASYAEHDAFTAAGLGGTAARLLAFLAAADQPVTAAELAEASGLHVSTVRTTLRDRLASAGLADRVEGRWFARAGDLDLLAVAMGTDGTGEARKALHEYDRQRYEDTRALKQRQRLRAIDGARVDRTRRAAVAESRRAIAR